MFVGDNSLCTGLLLASFLTDGTYRGHFEAQGKIGDCARIATSILDSIRNPADEGAVKVARGLAITQQLRPLAHRHDLTVEEICRTVSPLHLCLFAVEVPGIPIDAYIERLVADMRCGLECFVMAIIYILRCASCIPICGRSLHRVMLTSVIIAAKTRDDKYYPMSFYAKIGGTTKREVEAMEIAMLDILGFDARVPTATYIDMIYSLRMHCSTLAYVRKCAWAGRAWGQFIANVPMPRASDLAAEINGLALSTYSETCDFTIHNTLSANYSTLEGGSPLTEVSVHIGSSKRGDAEGLFHKGILDIPSTPNVIALMRKKAHRRTVSHPARIFHASLTQRLAFFSSTKVTFRGTASLPATSHTVPKNARDSPSISLVRGSLGRTRSELSTVSRERSPAQWHAYEAQPDVSAREAPPGEVLVQRTPSQTRPLRLSFDFDVSRSCPVERINEPFVDPCWNLSVSISASTATPAASGSAHPIHVLDVPAKSDCRDIFTDPFASQAGSDSSFGPSPYCSTDGSVAPALSRSY